jgi:hypothetical protein
MNVLDEKSLKREAAREIIDKIFANFNSTKDLDLFVPPKDQNTWLRFRNVIPSFFDVVIDE